MHSKVICAPRRPQLSRWLGPPPAEHAGPGTSTGPSGFPRPFISAFSPGQVLLLAKHTQDQSIWDRGPGLPAQRLLGAGDRVSLENQNFLFPGPGPGFDSELAPITPTGQMMPIGFSGSFRPRAASPVMTVIHAENNRTGSLRTYMAMGKHQTQQHSSK